MNAMIIATNMLEDYNTPVLCVGYCLQLPQPPGVSAVILPACWTRTGLSPSGWSFAALTSDLQISVTYSHAGAFLVPSTRPPPTGWGSGPRCLGSGSQADSMPSLSGASLFSEQNRRRLLSIPADS